MSVDDPKTVDFVSLESVPDTALLIVADHLEWTRTLEHELALQEKLNAYSAFIEGGELYARFPEARGKRIEIRALFKYEPDAEGNAFLNKVKGPIEGAGFYLSQQVGVEPISADRPN